MFEKLLFWRKPKPAALPTTVVRGSMSAGPNRRLHAGFLDMETFMSDAGMAARAEGIDDPDQIRKRKNDARQALKRARNLCRQTGDAVEFKFGGVTHKVTPYNGIN